MTVHRDVARLAQLGWRLHPVSQYSRAACIKDATELATCDLNQLDRWSWEFPRLARRYAGRRHLGTRR